jgi:hypothetical protein
MEHELLGDGAFVDGEEFGGRGTEMETAPKCLGGSFR